jgi:hypothetical protein
MKLIPIFLLLVFFGCAGQASSLSEEEKTALGLAIDDEYKARATYAGVISKFGNVQPFTNIREAEEQHISALKSLYSAYGLEVPEDKWPDNAPVFDSVQDACAAGVQAEIDNAALYENISKTVDKQDILDVFERLGKASKENHLPAFQRCS